MLRELSAIRLCSRRAAALELSDNELLELLLPADCTAGVAALRDKIAEARAVLLLALREILEQLKVDEKCQQVYKDFEKLPLERGGGLRKMFEEKAYETRQGIQKFGVHTVSLDALTIWLGPDSQGDGSKCKNVLNENAAKNDFIGNSDAVTKRMSFMEFGIDSFDAQKLALNLPLRTEHDATHGTVAVRVRGSGPSGVSDNSSTVKV